MLLKRLPHHLRRELRLHIPNSLDLIVSVSDLLLVVLPEAPFRGLLFMLHVINCAAEFLDLQFPLSNCLLEFVLET